MNSTSSPGKRARTHSTQARDASLTMITQRPRSRRPRSWAIVPRSAARRPRGPAPWASLYPPARSRLPSPAAMIPPGAQDGAHASTASSSSSERMTVITRAARQARRRRPGRRATRARMAQGSARLPCHGVGSRRRRGLPRVRPPARRGRDGRSADRAWSTRPPWSRRSRRGRASSPASAHTAPRLP